MEIQSKQKKHSLTGDLDCSMEELIPKDHFRIWENYKIIPSMCDIEKKIEIKNIKNDLIYILGADWLFCYERVTFKKSKSDVFQLHRNDGLPACICPIYIAWHKHGVCHRTDGPAVEYRDGQIEYVIDGCWHRQDGPAIINKCGIPGNNSWWINHKMVKGYPTNIVQPIIY